ncbi:hypothetical protein QR685DRAFT_214247 [Neurospora intermedia]|uniref:DUF6594 domain-containing protein n=1 Tax=Neurospora intermedia TaxID=5142 RepID=A0ABR3DGH4_NEUIN
MLRLKLQSLERSDTFGGSQDSVNVSVGSRVPGSIESGRSSERDRQIQRNKLIRVSIPTGPWETFDNGDLNIRASALINTRTTSAKKAFWERVGAAVLGGAFLITPMWILALHRQLFVHLGIATGCVAAFGFSLSFYVARAEEVFAATLAYAAVIMVFVGIVIQETDSKGA